MITIMKALLRQQLSYIVSLRQLMSLTPFEICLIYEPFDFVHITASDATANEG